MKGEPLPVGPTLRIKRPATYYLEGKGIQHPVGPPIH